MLTLVPTPIGNLDDVSGRQRDVLASAAVVVCEDTRTTKRLYDLLEIDRDGKRFVAFHDHSETDAVDGILNWVESGDRVVYASDAGTPCISDPGFRLVRRAHERRLPVTALPGPCAAVVALSMSGLPTDAFSFQGFLPKKEYAKREVFERLKRAGGTSVFYETAVRMYASLMLLAAVDETAMVGIGRELTKRHETFYRGTVGHVIDEWSDTIQKGECVLVVYMDGNRDSEVEALVRRLSEVSLAPKTIKAIVADTFDVHRSTVSAILERLKLERGG